MAVLPINSVSVETNQYAFTGRKDKKNSHKANTLAGLPVVVMLAMAPLSTDGKQPAQFVPIDNAHITELVAAVNANAPKTYAETQAPQKASKPYHMEYLKTYKIQETIKCMGNQQSAYLVLTNSKKASDKKGVEDIYYIKEGTNSTDITEAPPKIIEIIYHDLGKNEFLGIKTTEMFYDKNNNIKIMDREIRLDDKAAQYLIDFLAGETAYTDYTGIKFKTTTNEKVAPPKIY
jgi:hypothetical protein